MEEDLKVSVGVDTTKAERGIKDLEKITPNLSAEVILKIRNRREKEQELKELQRKLAQVKLDPSAFPKEDVKKLNAEIKKTKEELKAIGKLSGRQFFRETYEEANRLAAKVKEIKLDPKKFSSEDVKILRSEIEAAALKAKTLNFSDGSSKTQNLLNNLTSTSKELDKISGQTGHTNKTFGIMDITIGNLAANLATKVLGTLKNITLEGAKFNQQMEFATEKTRTISSSGGAEINSNTWQMAKNMGVNPLELKEGLYQVVSAIGDTHKKYALLETSNKLATVGFSTTAESVDGLTTVLNAYNLGMDEADRVANVFVRTQKVGKLTVQEFNRELYKTIPVAKELSIGIDEVGASIALLTAKGSKAEIAQTQMGAFMYELLDVGSDVSKLFTKISGQTLESYMSNGGNFEGILRQLKGYSDTNNFKIESLFGRKEAKSFWLNVGKDIDGYVDKLNAINDPVNELQRNFENLLNTQEKRLARAGNYWLSFKQTIGGVAGEILATLGDFVTGANTEAAARQRLNNELDSNLKTLEELSKKQSLNKEEQTTLNKALENLMLLAPNVAEAYKNWSINGGDYAEVLKEIHKAQLEVNKENEKLSIITKEKKVKDTAQTKAELASKLDPKNEFAAQQKKYYEKYGEFSNKNRDEWIEEKAKKIANSGEKNEETLKFIENYTAWKGAVEELKKSKEDLNATKEKLLTNFKSNVNGDNSNNSNKTLQDKIKENKISIDIAEANRFKNTPDKSINDIPEYKALIEKKKELEALAKDHNKLIQTDIEILRKQINSTQKGTSDYEILKSDIENKEKTLIKIPGTTEEVKGNFINYDSLYKDLEKNKQLALIQAKNDYANKLKTSSEETRPSIDESYQNRVAKIEDESRLAELELKINELKAKISNETDKSVIDNVNKEIQGLTLQKDDVQANAALRDIENIKNKEKLKKTEQEKLYQLQEQQLKNTFNNKRITIEEKFQNDLKELEKNYSAERYEKLKEERAKELDLINKNEKIALLNSQITRLNPAKDKIKIEGLNNEITQTNLDFDNLEVTNKMEELEKERTQSNQKVIRSIDNLARLFQTVGDNSNSQSMKNVSSLLNMGLTLSNTFTDLGGNLFSMNDKVKDGLAGTSAGMSVGSTITAMAGGNAQDQLMSNIGGTAGAIIGGAIGGPVGAMIGSSIGSTAGGVLSSISPSSRKKKKKAKREQKRAEEAQRRLKEGQISGQFAWQDTMEAFNEELERSGLGTKMEMLDSVSKNTNYDSIKSSLTSGAIGQDGIKLSTLKELMPHMSEQEIIDWFKATTGGAVVNGDNISTGEGKYGAIDMGALAQQITQANKELEQSLKETIKNTIDFTADKIAGVVKNGFGDGIDDLGANLEKAIADSLKNAFLQTEIAKGLFNGLSDKVTDMITDMFKNDKNLGIDLNIDNLKDLSISEYIEVIKQYMQLGNEELKSIFEELGISLDNLNNTVDKANKNSKNTVQGMATNLWLQNLGVYQSEAKKFAALNTEINMQMSRFSNLENTMKEKINDENGTTNLEKIIKNITIENPDFAIENIISLELDGKKLDTKINSIVEKIQRINNQQTKAMLRFR